jgi:hypothetical protein
VGRKQDCAANRRLIDAAPLIDRRMLIVLYSTGMRNAELRRPAGQRRARCADPKSSFGEFAAGF